jgi:hypothetical protein
MVSHPKMARLSRRALSGRSSKAIYSRYDTTAYTSQEQTSSTHCPASLINPWSNPMAQGSRFLSIGSPSRVGETSWSIKAATNSPPPAPIELAPKSIN